MQLLTVIIAALVSLHDSGVYGRIELWHAVELGMGWLVLAGFPVAVVGGLMWIVELLRWRHRFPPVYWFQVLQPLLAIAWFWCALPLFQ